MSTETETKIARFLARKDAEFPMLGLLGRKESQTVKFPFPRHVIHAAHP
jgi:hypothetical protein